MNKLNILHVLAYSIPNISGYTIRSKYLIESEKSLGLQPTVITSPKYEHEKPYTPQVSYDGIIYHRTRVRERTLKIPFINEALLIKSFNKQINSIVQQEKIDIIHAHSPSLNGLSSLNISRSRKKIPVVYHIRALWEDAGVESGKMQKGSLKYKVSYAAENFLIRRTDCIVTICQGLKKELISRGYESGKIHVIENGVDTAIFSPRPPCNDLIRQYNLSDSCVVGFIGSFFKFEGVEHLVKAYKNVTHNSQKLTKLMLVGAGEELELIKRMVSEYHLNDNIIITGRVPHEKILDYYSIMDILVYPRIRKRITEMVTPLKPLEALAMGKAVIGSDVGGIKELIIDGETGVLYPAEDDRKLAEIIIQLANNAGQREKLGDQGREAMLSSRNWGYISKKMLDIYSNLIS